MKSTDKVFAKRIKTAMKKKGLNKITLAPLIDDKCTDRVTETWIAGANYPHGERLKRLGKILFPYGLDYLFGFIDEPNLDNKTAAEYTGLSPEAIENIRTLNREIPDILNILLVTYPEELRKLLLSLRVAAKAANESEEAPISDYKQYEYLQLEAKQQSRNTLERILDSIPPTTNKELSSILFKDGDGSASWIQNKNRPE